MEASFTSKRTLCVSVCPWVHVHTLVSESQMEISKDWINQEYALG